MSVRELNKLSGPDVGQRLGTRVVIFSAGSTPTCTHGLVQKTPLIGISIFLILEKQIFNQSLCEKNKNKTRNYNTCT